ncbi:MAG TPA: MFS transporter [Solirubrobacterales bacterium]|nr:MFS transporter [Solirubrobacterales bacterium]
MSSTKGSYLVLTAMIFAVSMTFIDQTIVSISVPEIQKELSLSSTGVQWIVSGYLLSMAALFAFGGKLADVLGRRRMLVIGILIFAVSSALCGATPKGELAEAWIIFFRVVQGAGAAIMFPAALAITISAFPIETRGRAMALFFGITGALTSVGPIAGGYLTEWTWRSIFWINIPIALISLFLIWKSKPANLKNPQPLDFRGAVLIVAGMGLAVLGLQQSATWGWSNPLTIGSIVAGLAILVGFFVYESKLSQPLMRVKIFKNRAFLADNMVLFLLSIAFVPLFFFASMYSQISLGSGASEAGIYLLIFFAGFAVASQWGGRILDSKGAKPAVLLGSALAAVGFFLWAQQMTDISAGVDGQWIYMVMAGAGVGLILGPVSTDAINRAPNTSYGEATGITQTVRNFAAAFGLAVLGTILTTRNKVNVENVLESGPLNLSKSQSDSIAHSLTQSGGGDSGSVAGHSGGGIDAEIFHDIQGAFAHSTQTVFYIMAGVMAAAYVVAHIWMVKGKMVEVFDDPADHLEQPDQAPASDTTT